MLLNVLPTTAHPVAADTWLIPTLAESPTGGVFGAHSLVIRGREPMLVDTGSALVRDAWLEQAFSVVDPEDVRWVFLSHDDHDHTGNLDVVLARCPNATLVANFGIVGRLALDTELPLDRMRWLEAGDTLDIGDRQLTIVRPPTFDSPATRGFHDSKTQLLWAVDSFGALVQGEVYEAGDVPRELYEPSFAMLNTWNTPWLEWLDTERFAAHVQTTAGLPTDIVVSAHGPVLRGAQIEDAFARTQALAAQPPAPQPGQSMLDELLSSLLAPAPA
jgi:flavorubredoxin